MDAHVIMHFDGRQWMPAQIHRDDATLFDTVRSLLGGPWSRSHGNVRVDGARAFWCNSTGRRVLVMTQRAAMSLQAAAS